MGFSRQDCRGGFPFFSPLLCFLGCSISCHCITCLAVTCAHCFHLTHSQTSFHAASWRFLISHQPPSSEGQLSSLSSFYSTFATAFDMIGHIILFKNWLSVVLHERVSVCVCPHFLVVAFGVLRTLSDHQMLECSKAPTSVWLPSCQWTLALQGLP